MIGQVVSRVVVVPVTLQPVAVDEQEVVGQVVVRLELESSVTVYTSQSIWQLETVLADEQVEDSLDSDLLDSELLELALED